MKKEVLLLIAVLFVAVSCQAAPAPTHVPTVALAAPTALAPTSTPIPPTPLPLSTATRTATPTTAPARPIATVLAPVLPTPVPPPPRPPVTKQVNLLVVEGGYPAPARMAWMGYFDENAQRWMKMTAVSDATGYAVFQVPLANSGESYFFTFASSDADLSRFCAEIGYGRWSAFKIPADPTQFAVTLQMDTGRLTTQVLQGRVDIRVMK